MTEQLISFETAELLDQKDFKFRPKLFYILEDKKVYSHITRSLSDHDVTAPLLYAPTQSLLQKWLREEKKIHVCTDVSITGEWYFQIYNLKDKRCHEFSEIHEKFNDVYFDTYEEALEIGLQEGLKLIE